MQIDSYHGSPEVSAIERDDCGAAFAGRLTFVNATNCAMPQAAVSTKAAPNGRGQRRSHERGERTVHGLPGRS